MSCKEFKSLDATSLPIGKLIAIISKGQTIYMNRKLDEFGINSTQLHLLFEISNQNDINQEKIASRCNINKGAVARSIKKLEDNGLVVRQIDSSNRRQNKVSLTKKGKDIVDKSIELIGEWEDEIFNNDLIKKEDMQKVLKEIAVRIMEINEREALNEQK